MGRVDLSPDASVNAVAFSPDGTLVYAVDGAGAVIVVDADARMVLETLYSHRGEGSAIAVSGDGTTVASGDQGGNVVLLDGRSGTVREALTGLGGRVIGVSLSKNGDRLAVQIEDREVRVYDMSPSGGRDAATLATGVDIVYTARPTSDGSAVAVLDGDGALLVWEPATDAIRWTTSIVPAYWPVGFTQPIAVSPDDTTLMVGDAATMIRSIDLATGAILAEARLTDLIELPAESVGIPLSILGLDFLTSGDQLAVGGNGFISVIGSDLRSGNPVGPRRLTNAVTVSAGRDELVTVEQAIGVMSLWPAQPDAERLLRILNSRILHADLAPDGQTIAVGRSDSILEIMDREGNPLHSIPAARGPIQGVAFSPDDSRLAVAYQDGTISIFDPISGEHQMTLTGHDGQALSVAWSADGRFLVSAGSDGTVRMYAMAEELLLDTVRIRLTRDFTGAECDRYATLGVCD